MPRYARYLGVTLVLALLLALAGWGMRGWYSAPAEPQPLSPVVEEVPTVPAAAPDPRIAVIGASVEGRAIESYAFGTGERHLLMVGGIHGGYEWNSTLLAYEMIDHFTQQPELIPDRLSVTIVPAANPDGLYRVMRKEGKFTLADVPADEGPLGNGRFNANNVDLNRNFDCKWQPKSTWRGNTVSAGSAPFSEPEAVAIQTVVDSTKPAAVVFWHSQSNAVYASECENGILPGTRTLMQTYARASGYPAVDVFDAYTVTGDAEGWLASIGIPAITVELSTHKTVEWERNLAGVTALLAHYGQPEAGTLE